MQLRDWRLILLWENRWRILAAGLIAATAALLVSLSMPKTYMAESRVAFTRIVGVNGGVTGGFLLTKAELLLNEELAERVGAKMSPPLDARGVLRRLSVAPVRNSNVLAIQAVDSDPARAAALSTEVAREYVRASREKRRARLERSLQRLETPLAASRSRLATLVALSSREPSNTAAAMDLAVALKTYYLLQGQYDRLNRERQLDQLEVVVSALGQLDDKPVSPQPIRSAFAGLAVGLLAAGALVFVAHRLRANVWSLPEIQERLDAPVLAAIPEAPGEEGSHDSASRSVERDRDAAYEALAMKLSGLCPSETRGPILVTSPSTEDSSDIALKVARSMASSERRVLLVSPGGGASSASECARLAQTTTGDADVRRAGGVEAGLVKIPGSSLFVFDPDEEPPRALDELNSEAFASVFPALSDSFDAVILDCPALVSSPVPLAQARQACSTLVVIEADLSKRDEVAEAGRLLAAVASANPVLCITRIPTSGAMRYRLDRRFLSSAKRES